MLHDPITLFNQALSGDAVANKKLEIIFACKQLNSWQFKQLYNHWRSVPQQKCSRYYYLSGLIHRSDISPDHKKAAVFYAKAVALKHPGAMASLAFMYARGQHGGCVNNAVAIRLYGEAIALEDPTAMNNRAFMHEHGKGGPVDYAAAIDLYERAIALKYASAMNSRACMHMMGKGGPVNYAAAIALYNQAIELGNVRAVNNRAHMHENGIGGPVNLDAAVNLYINTYHQINPPETKTQIEKKLKALLPRLTFYYHLKVSSLIPELNSSPILAQVKAFFFPHGNREKEVIMAIFKKDVPSIFKNMIDDKESPISKNKQKRYCQWLLDENPTFLINGVKDNPAALELIGEALLSMAADANAKKKYTLANQYYAQIPKGCTEYANARFQLALAMYCQEKEAGSTAEEVSQRTLPFLNTALALGDKAAEALRDEIETAIENETKSKGISLRS